MLILSWHVCFSSRSQPWLALNGLKVQQPPAWEGAGTFCPTFHPKKIDFPEPLHWCDCYCFGWNLIKASLFLWSALEQPFQTRTRSQGRALLRQLIELLFLWQLLSALLRVASLSGSLRRVRLEWHRPVARAQAVNTQGEKSRQKLTDLLSKTSSSTGSRRTSCRTTAEAHHFSLNTIRLPNVG